MLRLWTQQAMEEPEKCPPVRKRMVERKAGAGAPGKLWRSTRGRDQKLSGDYWCMCISLELCCFTPQEFSDRMHYPKQLRDSRFWVRDKPISYLPVKGITSFLLSLPLHPPAWQPFPCNSTITIQVTSESWADSKTTLVKRVEYTELHLKSPRSLSWGNCRY